MSLSRDFKILSDPTRLALLLILDGKGPGRSVTALADDVMASVQKTSHHLRVALAEGMLEKTEWHWYRLTEKGKWWVEVARSSADSR